MMVKSVVECRHIKKVKKKNGKSTGQEITVSLFVWFFYHEVLTCQTHRVDGALDIDGGFFLRAVRIREVHLSAGSLHDVLDVAAVASHHGQMVLGRNVQLSADGNGARQAPG